MKQDSTQQSQLTTSKYVRQKHFPTLKKTVGSISTLRSGRKKNCWYRIPMVKSCMRIKLKLTMSYLKEFVLWPHPLFLSRKLLKLLSVIFISTEEMVLKKADFGITFSADVRCSYIKNRKLTLLLIHISIQINATNSSFVQWFSHTRTKTLLLEHNTILAITVMNHLPSSGLWLPFARVVILQCLII